jgi:SOS-response transcriptional repressor LexA
MIAHELTQESDKLIDALIGKIPAGEPMELSAEFEYQDLNYLLTRGVYKPLLIQIDGESMIPDVARGDWVMVAIGRMPEPSDIILAYLNGGYTLKRWKLNDKRGRPGLFLVPANGKLPDREIREDDDYAIVGTVTHIIHPTA